MSDHTEMSGWLYSVPKGKAKKVAALFNDYALDEDHGARYHKGAWTPAEVRELIDAQVQFTDDQFQCGSGHDLAKALRKLGCVFEFHEDPKYEWMGDLHMWHPELGQFYSICDADGETTIGSSEIQHLERKFPKAGSRWVELRARLGVDYIEKFHALVRPPETVDV